MEEIKSEIINLKSDELISNSLENISEFTQDLLMRAGIPAVKLTKNTFNAFRLCAIELTKVVILSAEHVQDDSDGLLFGGKTTVNSKGIINCLKFHELIDGIPVDNNFKLWADQGVLLLNCNLSNEPIWDSFCSNIVGYISECNTSIVFVLLGGTALSKRKYIKADVIITGIHTSPLEPMNKTDNPKNFKYCDIFLKVNDEFISQGVDTINWSLGPVLKSPLHNMSKLPLPIEVPKFTLWVFTDGAAKKNGKIDCVASWAYVVTDGNHFFENAGLVQNICVDSEVYTTSNNRGELTAILMALRFIKDNHMFFEYSNIVIVSDSKYSINCISEWGVKWMTTNAQDKKNMDLITECINIVKIFNKCIHLLTFKHTRSHQKTPMDGLFIFSYNNYVDLLCAKVLK